MSMIRGARVLGLLAFAVAGPVGLATAEGDVPAALEAWLGPQKWQRDLDEPTLSLGAAGEFDDTHLFAPTVVQENGQYRLWYCGSTGSAHDLAPTRTPDERVFQLGLATSDDGLRFRKHAANPVLAIDQPRRSVLTPSVLRTAEGVPVRENGRLRMWFSSADFQGKSGGHVVQESTSEDGVRWSAPSQPQLAKAYAPSVLKTADGYQLWYVDVTAFPWTIRHATSADGAAWQTTPRPVLELTQPWEHRVVIYPCVLAVDGVYLMWYGSYATADRETTAIGFAVSEDGVTWHKHPDNPVMESDPSRPWETHYVGNQSVVRLADGSFRMWYASRKAPPFRNLYFAISSASWKGPPAASPASPRRKRRRTPSRRATRASGRSPAARTAPSSRAGRCAC